MSTTNLILATIAALFIAVYVWLAIDEFPAVRAALADAGDLFKSDATLAAEFWAAGAPEVPAPPASAAAEEACPPVNRAPYVGRHWASDVQHTDIFAVINPSIPAQRTGDEA